MNILIADDKPYIRRLVRAMVETRGWNVCAEAENGVQAVTRAEQCKPDAIVLDLAMPEMNGIEAARQIVKTFPGVPIFLFTFYDCPLIEQEACRVGIQRVISKSDAPTLVPAIEEAFAHREAA